MAPEINELEFSLISFINLSILFDNFINNMENYQKTNLNIGIDVFDGLYVDRLEISSLAYVSGVRSGDVILSINGVDMVDNMALLNVAYSNEKNFEFKVLRNNEELINIINILK